MFVFDQLRVTGNACPHETAQTAAGGWDKYWLSEAEQLSLQRAFEASENLRSSAEKIFSLGRNPGKPIWIKPKQYYSERYPTLLRNSGILDNNQVNRKLDT